MNSIRGILAKQIKIPTMDYYKILALLAHPLRFFKEKTSIILSAIKGEKGNAIETQSAYIKKSRIQFQGKDNLIQLNNSALYNSSVFIRGNGHRLIIDEGAALFNIRIKIIGNDNTVHIKYCSHLGGGNIICGGVRVPIVIGENCRISEGVDIWSTDTHSITQDGKLLNAPRPIQIGSHVWIGKDVAILKGVTIGDNAIIGMKSIVTKDIEAGTVNIGAPAKAIRENVEWSLTNPNNEQA